MKFLIIGSSGFIGCHLKTHIQSLGYEVIGTQTHQKSVDFKKFDLFKDRIFEKIESSFFESNSPVFGIICSAISQIDRCHQEREKTYHLNVEKTKELIDDFKTLNVKPVFISSDQVFDGEKGYYAEEDQTNPINEYGRQKLAIETYLQEKMSDDSLIFRLSKVVGDASQQNHLLSDLSQKIKTRQTIHCIKSQWFSPTLVTDITRGIVLGCDHNLSGVYHLANPQFFEREEWVKQFAFALNEEVEIVVQELEKFNFAARRPLKTYLDPTKFIKATGMQFTFMSEAFQTFKEY